METKIIVAFVDALGPSQLARAQGQKWWTNERSTGGVLGYSCSALPTLLTGTAPAAHGRMCLFSRAADTAGGMLKPLTWLGLLPKVVHERGTIRRAAAHMLRCAEDLQGYVDLYRIPPELFSWLDMREREDLFHAQTIGGQHTFLHQARLAGLRVFTSPWQFQEDERWAHAHRMCASHRPQLSFLYSTKLDGHLHRNGNDAAATSKILKQTLDHIARYAEILAQDGSNVKVIMTGDHGMADVTRGIDPRQIVARSQMRAFVDSTMLRVWGSPAAIKLMQHQTRDAGWPGKWLSKADLDERQAPTEGSPYGDAIFVLDEGNVFSPSHMGGMVRGMHGYDLGSPSSFAALASNAGIPEHVRQLSDIAGWVCDELGLKVESNKGDASWSHQKQSLG